MAKQGSNNKELFYEDFPGLFFCEYFSRQKYNTFRWGRAIRMSSDLNLMLFFFVRFLLSVLKETLIMDYEFE